MPPRQPPKAEWMEETARRLLTERARLARLGEGGPADAESPIPSVSLNRVVATMQAPGTRPLDLPTDAESELRALTVGKNAPADFQPQRHVLVVAGRPTMALPGACSGGEGPTTRLVSWRPSHPPVPD
jgi:hypothetical protein